MLIRCVSDEGGPYAVLTYNSQTFVEGVHTLFRQDLAVKLDYFVGIVDAAAKDCGEDHLDIFGEGVMMEIVEVNTDFVGKYYLVVIFLSFRLLCEHFFFVAILKRIMAGNSRS